MGSVKFLNVEAEPGEKAFGKVRLGELPDGNNIEIPVHVINGAKPGPSLLITNALHGDAMGTAKMIRDYYLRLDPEKLRGAVVIIPVANPLAAATNTRHTLQDGWNMNRVFPARFDNPHNPGWVTQQMATVLTDAVDQTDCLLDYHSGYGTIIHYIYARTTNPDEFSHELEVSSMFGFKYLYAGTPAWSGTITDYAASQGKDALLVEHGGIGMPDWCYEEAIQGIFNIMKYKGMVDGTPVLPDIQYVIRDKHRPLMRARNGGWFVPEVGVDMLNEPIKKGNVLGRILNLYDFREVETLYAPVEESVPLMMKTLPGVMVPGDYTYIIGERSTALQIKNK